MCSKTDRKANSKQNCQGFTRDQQNHSQDAIVSKTLPQDRIRQGLLQSVTHWPWFWRRRKRFWTAGQISVLNGKGVGWDAKGTWARGRCLKLHKQERPIWEFRIGKQHPLGRGWNHLSLVQPHLALLSSGTGWAGTPSSYGDIRPGCRSLKSLGIPYSLVAQLNSRTGCTHNLTQFKILDSRHYL